VTVYIGTSGWQYKHWLGSFYPREQRSRELAYYAERFQTVEINASFYKLPSGHTFREWAGQAPDDFVFAVKGSRFLTHMKRLKDPKEPADRLMRRAERLGDKLGPVLLQLPSNMRCDLGRLEETLEAFRGRARLAFEFRHESWFVDDVRRTLERHDAALCIADRESKLVTPAWRTADWGYMRFHEGTAKPVPCYGRGSLESRAKLIDETWSKRSDVYVYFNNDTHGCALRDAAVFARAIEKHGLRPTRVPETREVRVAG
jgi:uncharacterized protein YecE (DUF72 family)